MRKMFIALAATSALALGACQSPAADKVEDQAEAQADVIDDQADGIGQQARDTRLAGTRRAPQDHRRKLARRDHAAVEIEDTQQFGAVKTDLSGLGSRAGKRGDDRAQALFLPFAFAAAAAQPEMPSQFTDLEACRPKRACSCSNCPARD